MLFRWSLISCSHFSTSSSMYFNELLYIQSLMVCEHTARQNTSSQRHDSCCSMKQVHGFYIAYIGIFLHSEGRSRTFFFWGWGGGWHHECQRRELCRGDWGYIFQKFLKIWVSKMAIPSILRLILNTIFLLVNFAIVQKKKRGGEHKSPAPPPPPWIRNCKFTSIFNSSCFLEFG